MISVPTKTPVACALLMAILIATISETMAESPCSNFHGKPGKCRDQVEVCHFIRRTNKCANFPTAEKCDERKKKLSCKKIGCTWNDDGKFCFVEKLTRPLFIFDIDDPRPDNEEPDIEGSPRPDNEEPDIEGPPRPDKEERDIDSEFWERMEGGKTDVVLQKINEKYGDKYNVYICQEDYPDMGDLQCLLKNLDSSRVKLWVNNNKKRVREITIG